MNARPFKTAYELQDMIVEHASTLHGPWPAGMTLFVFDDAYGWNREHQPAEVATRYCYRTRTFDLIAMLKSMYDLDALRLSGPDDAWWLRSLEYDRIRSSFRGNGDALPRPACGERVG